MLTLLTLLAPRISLAQAPSCPEGRWWHFDRESGGPDNDFVNAVAFDEWGRGYFGTGDLHPPETHGGGLAIRDVDGSWTRIRMDDGGLRSNSVYALGIAGDGVLVGSLAGVDRLIPAPEGGPPSAWHPLPDQPVPPFALADVLDILVDGRARQWFATTFGLFVLEGETWSRYGTSSEEDGLDSRFVTAVAEAPDGGIWIGTQGKGVAVRASDGSWTHHRAADGGLGNDYVYDIAFDEGGRAWIGTGIGVSVFGEAGWTVHTPGDSPLPDPDVRAVARDDRGRIWLATHRGLAVVEDGRWRVCPASDGDARQGDSAAGPPGGHPTEGLTHPLVVSAAAGPGGSMWFGTYGGGVFAWWPADR